MLPNARNSESIFRMRLTLMELCKNREILYHLPTTSVAVNPRVTYGELYERLDMDLKSIAPFKPVTDIDHLFTSNGKMIVPCFSLPAGPVEFGGTCPASNAYFDMPEADFIAADGSPDAISLSPSSVMTHRKYVGTGDPAKWVCNKCYALAGNFGLPSVVLKYVVVQMWVERQLEAGTLADSLIAGIRFNRDFLRRSCAKRYVKKGTLADLNETQIAELANSDYPHPDYFRLHDTGDFFSPQYLEAWCETAEALRDIRIWASTRAWVVPEIAAAMRGLHVPKNLVLRPSELFLDAEPRTLPAPLTAGSMIHTKAAGKAGQEPSPAIYRCPATHGDVKTCQGSAGNYAGRAERNAKISWPSGCRFCWDAVSRPVVYKEH